MKFELDGREAQKVIRQQARDLSDAKMKRAQARALNRAVRGARTEFSREVRKTVRVKASEVRGAVSLVRAKASEATPTATLVVKQKTIPLVRFGTPRQTKRGVSVTVIKGKRQKIEGAFIVKSLGGHIFKREGDDRLPVRKLFGPSVRQLAPEALKAASPAISERLATELERAVNLEVEKAFKKGKG